MPAEQPTLLECDYASCGIVRPERFTLIDVINEPIRVNKASLQRHGEHVVRRFHPLPTIWNERNKLLQILSALIHAADGSSGELGRREAELTVRVETRGDRVNIEIETERVIVPRDNVFNPRAPENGEADFDSSSRLHLGARMAKELGGRPTAFGTGAGAAASYRLQHPLGEKGGGYG